MDPAVSDPQFASSVRRICRGPHDESLSDRRTRCECLGPLCSFRSSSSLISVFQKAATPVSSPLRVDTPANSPAATDSRSAPCRLPVSFSSLFFPPSLFSLLTLVRQPPGYGQQPGHPQGAPGGYGQQQVCTRSFSFLFSFSPVNDAPAASVRVGRRTSPGHGPSGHGRPARNDASGPTGGQTRRTESFLPSLLNLVFASLLPDTVPVRDRWACRAIRGKWADRYRVLFPSKIAVALKGRLCWAK